MSNNPSGPRDQFDLAERTAEFGSTVIRLARSAKLDPVTGPIVRQLVRAGTSVGANYVEADEAGSRKEFRYRISLLLTRGERNTTLGSDAGRGEPRPA